MPSCILIEAETDRTMNILLIDQSAATRNLLIRKLVPLGINVYHAEDPQAAARILASVQVNLLLLDIDPAPLTMLEFVHSMGQLKTKPIRLIISSITDKGTIMPFVEAGIAGYFLKPFTEDNGLGKLVTIIKNSSEGDQRRNFYRVSPSPNENVKVAFRIPSSGRLIMGRMLNVSAGGMAINCAGDLEPDELQARTLLPKVQVTIDNQNVYVSGPIVYRKANVIAIRFAECTEKDLYVISKYIFDRISQTI